MGLGWRDRMEKQPSFDRNNPVASVYFRAHCQSPIAEVRMPKLNMPGTENRHEAEVLPKNTKPELLRYCLQIDRQTKTSFNSFEAAEKKGKEIKKTFPVVQVAVFDAVKGERTILS
jgi:hypothetical protein